VWGTCAGAILLAKNIEGNQTADGLEVMDVTIERNSYGRQVESFETEIKFNGKNIPAVFIRAPRILKIGDGVEALSHEGEDIVAAREGNMFVTTFHPEMTEDLSVYEYFLDRCQSAF
ncbi:pyridoxal 5'-phosphate synthase glutaminase subunit PdxT, partial [Candidatus Peregrinibacteria bacterium]|nr:pyridoxal 5'-phosphate synthase glutaminase subunit PdxT [Candidatus Peregrinibacteria bacterium]